MHGTIPQVAYSHEGSGPHLIHGYFGPPDALSWMSYQSHWLFFQDTQACPTDQQTDTGTDIHEDHITVSVSTGYYRHINAAMWFNDIYIRQVNGVNYQIYSFTWFSVLLSVHLCAPGIYWQNWLEVRTRDLCVSSQRDDYFTTVTSVG